MDTSIAMDALLLLHSKVLLRKLVETSIVWLANLLLLLKELLRK